MQKRNVLDPVIKERNLLYSLNIPQTPVNTSFATAQIKDLSMSNLCDQMREHSLLKLLGRLIDVIKNTIIMHHAGDLNNC